MEKYYEIAKTQCVFSPTAKFFRQINALTNKGGYTRKRVDFTEIFEGCRNFIVFFHCEITGI